MAHGDYISEITSFKCLLWPRLKTNSIKSLKLPRVSPHISAHYLHQFRNSAVVVGLQHKLYFSEKVQDSEQKVLIHVFQVGSSYYHYVKLIYDET